MSVELVRLSSDDGEFEEDLIVEGQRIYHVDTSMNPPEVPLTGWLDITRARIRNSDWFSMYYFLDWAVCLLVILIVEGPLNTFITPHEVFFMEGDYSQSYPLESSTVPNWALAVVMNLPPIITTVCILLWRRDDETNKRHEIHHAVLSWLMACTINFMICDTVKYACGRHRPDYFARQAADISAFEQKNAHLSFPSGHSSGSFTSMTFLFLWICGKLKIFHQGHFFTLLAAGVPLYFSTWVAVTRVQNYKHNYSDILAGILLGLISGAIGYLMNFPSVLDRNSNRPKNKKAAPLSRGK